jgi:hypothetical protein
MVTIVDFKKRKNAEGKEFAVLILKASNASIIKKKPEQSGFFLIYFSITQDYGLYAIQPK